jgi:catalase
LDFIFISAFKIIILSASQVRNYQRDGAMTVDGNQNGAPNYFPNSFNGPAPSDSAASHVESASGDVARHETGHEDNFSQCRVFFNKVLSHAERERLTDNIVGSLIDAQQFLQERAIANFASVDALYGRMVADKLTALKKKVSKLSGKTASAPLNPPRVVVRSLL